MKKLIFIFCLFLSIGLQAQTVSISCETCQWLKSSDCDVCSSIYKSKMFRGGLKIKKLGKTMYFEHPLSIELVNSKFKMTDANGQKFDFYLNETSFNSISALKSFIALCACSAPSDTSTIPQITDTDRRLTELAFVGDSLVATVRDINNNIVAKIVLDNAKGTTTPCRDSIWKVVDTIFHKNVFCNIQKVTMASSKTNGFFQLTTLADTSLYTTQAQTQCPSPSFAKLDSCNISYLFIYDCNAGNWFKYKTINSLVAGRTLYLDDITGNDVTAKKGCITCAWKDFNVASNSVQYSNNDLLYIQNSQLSLGTFNTKRFNQPSVTNVNISSELGTTISVGSYGGMAPIVGNTNIFESAGLDKETQIRINLDILNGTSISDMPIIKNYNANGEVYLILNKLQTFISASLLNAINKNNLLNIRDINNSSSFMIKLLSNNNNNTTLFANHVVESADLCLIKSGVRLSSGILSSKNNNIGVKIGHLTTGGYSGSASNLKVVNIDNTEGNVTSSNYDVFIENIDNTSFLSTISHSYEAQNNERVGPVSFNANNNYYFDSLNINISVSNFNSNNSLFYVTERSITNDKVVIKNSNITINVNNVKGLKTVLAAMSTMTLDNTKIILDIKNLNCYSLPNYLLEISKNTLINNSKIIIKGNFYANKGIYITNNTIDATSSINIVANLYISNDACINTNNNIKVSGLLVANTGFYSITPYLTASTNVTILPGCASNVLTSPNVTQLGTGIYVDPNFNN